jgi:hypothetical protein
MAVVDRDSTTITNILAEPTVINGPPRGPRTLRTVREVITPAADDTANSLYRFFRIPSNCTPVGLRISAADATTAGIISIGLYQTDENGGAVVDADLFATIDLSGGPFNQEPILFESGQYTQAESMQALWATLGLTADPNREYDVCALVTTTFNGGPTSILLEMDYVTG